MFNVKRKPDLLTISMAADPVNIDRACLEARKMLQEHDLERESFAVLLGMREALSNSIFHACNSDSSMEIFFELELFGEEITLTVEDNGPGFDWTKYTFDPPGSDASHGRGLAIMKNYFQNVVFNEKGNKVLMKKKCSKGAGMSEILIEGSNATVAPKHDIVSTMVDDFKYELKELVDRGVSCITLDLSNVEMMDSIGMGLLIAAYNSLNKRNGTLRLINVTNDIVGLLRTMRLDKHFEISS